MSIDMTALMRAVECVASFFLIGYLGFYLARKGWFTTESSDMLARLVASVVIPINLLYNINASTTKEGFLPLLSHIVIPAASIFIVMILAALFARSVGMPKAHRSVFITASSCSNTINIGLPINLALFGTDALPAVLIYYLGNTIAFWTVGNYLLASGGEDAVKAPVVSVETVKRVFSPPVLGTLAGMILLLLDIKIPPLFAIAGSQIAGMTTPLSIICIGIAIFQTGVANIRLTREVGLIALGRFVVSPLVMVLLLRFFPVPEMMRNVFIIQCSLPPMSNIALLAMRYKSDASFAAISVSFCTLCALVTVPIFMVLITSF